MICFFYKSYSEKSCKLLTHNQSALRDIFFQDATTNFDILFGFTEGDSTSSSLKNLDSRNSNLLGQLVQKLLTTNEFKVVEYFSTKSAFSEKFEQLFSSPALLLTFIDPNICYESSSLAAVLFSFLFFLLLLLFIPSTPPPPLPPSFYPLIPPLSS